MICEFCQRSVLAHESATQYQEGWAPLRAKGTNALRLAIRHERWAHGVCVSKVASGLSPEQPTLGEAA